MSAALVHSTRVRRHPEGSMAPFIAACDCGWQARRTTYHYGLLAAYWHKVESETVTGGRNV